MHIKPEMTKQMILLLLTFAFYEYIYVSLFTADSDILLSPLYAKYMLQIYFILVVWFEEVQNDWKYSHMQNSQLTEKLNW